jgi:protein transport protein HofC
VSTETQPETRDPVILAPAQSQSAGRPGGFRLRHLMYAVLYCALVLWLGVITGLALLSGIFGLIFAMVFAVVYLYAGRRSTQQEALLWGLAVTAERGMPLAPTFDVFAGQSRGEYRRKVRAAAHYLRQGLSLPQVLEHEPRLFPRDAAVLIREAYACGTLAQALRESAAIRARLRGPWMALALRLAYLLWVLVVLQAISAFTFYFILPKFEAIFADFGVPLPAITVMLIEVSHFIVKYFYLFFPLLLLELGVLFCAAVAATGVLPWDLPLVAGVFYRRHSAIVLRCLAYVVEANRPMTEAIRSLARTYPAEPIRNRLQKVARDIDAGEDWCLALADRGLVRPAEASLLEAARRVGNLPWALRQAAETGERRLTYRFQFWVHWLLPLCVLAAGMLVFLIAVAYFTPLLVLIQKLSG